MRATFEFSSPVNVCATRSWNQNHEILDQIEIKLTIDSSSCKLIMKLNDDSCHTTALHKAHGFLLFGDQSVLLNNFQEIRKKSEI